MRIDICHASMDSMIFKFSCDYQEEQEHYVIRDEMEKRAQLKRKWRISNVMAKSCMQMKRTNQGDELDTRKKEVEEGN